MKFINKKDSSKRDFLSTAVLGEKGEGKSSFLAEYAKNYYATMQKLFADGDTDVERRVLIYDPSGEGRAYLQFEEITVEELNKGVLLPQTGKLHYWRKGIRVIRDNTNDEAVLGAIWRNVKNALVILDESADWLDSNNPKKWQQQIIRKHRNKAIDLVCAFHNFMDVPKRLRPHFWVWVIFRTPDAVPSADWLFRKDFPNSKQLYEAWLRVENSQYDPHKIIQYHEIFEKTKESRKKT